MLLSAVKMTSGVEHIDDAITIIIGEIDNGWGDPDIVIVRIGWRTTPFPFDHRLKCIGANTLRKLGLIPITGCIKGIGSSVARIAQDLKGAFVAAPVGRGTGHLNGHTLARCERLQRRRDHGNLWRAQPVDIRDVDGLCSEVGTRY